MSLAARVMGWQRRMGGVAGPLSASGEPSNGQPVTVEMFIDGVWIDITSYVMVRDDSGHIEINRGQSDEGDQPERSTCSFQLNNRDGRFSPRNPTGPYYGKIGRNTPLRVSVPLNGSKNYRFWGEVTKWPQNWDLSGTDFWVEVEAYGPLSRLEKGRVPDHSLLYNTLTDGSTPGLLAYWPLEDKASATITTMASAVSSASPMEITGLPELAQMAEFNASDPLPIMTEAMFSGRVAAYDPVTSCQVRFLLYIPSVGLNDGQVIASVWMDSLDIETWELYYTIGSLGEGQLVLRPLDGDGATLAGGVSAFGDINAKFLRVSIELVQNGANIDCTVQYLETGKSTATSATGNLNSKVLARVTKIEMAPPQVLGSATMGMPDSTVGHVTFQNQITSISDLGFRLDPAGEAAGRRFQRICDERNLVFESIGDLDDTIAMGDQQRIKPVEALQQCVEVDGGIMYETLNGFGLGYRTRASMLNTDVSLSFSYEDNVLAAVPVPVEDDRYIRNSIDVTRIPDEDASAHAEKTDGPLNIAEPPQGVGEIGQQVSVNVQYDSMLADQAGWRLHLGTIEEPRFPEIAFNLARSEITSARREAILSLRPGDRVAITSPPASQAPDGMALMVFGWTEQIDHFQHIVNLNCAPDKAFNVATADDTVYGRTDTAGSELLTAVGSGDTSLTVMTTSGPWWTTSSAEFPFDVRMGGERMTVTAISPSRYDTFTRSVSNGWGTANSGQSWTNAGGSAADYSVAATEGRHTCATVDTSRRTVLVSPTDDFDITCDVTANALSTGASQYGGPMARYRDIDNLYHARVEFTTSNTVAVSIQKRLAGVETTIGSAYTSDVTHSAGQYVSVRFQGIASNLRVKIWLASKEEPLEWSVDTSDGTLPSGDCGIRSIVFTGNTNVNPVLAYDNFSFNNPQTFTVTRSANGIVKSHSAGADIRLDDPAVLGL